MALGRQECLDRCGIHRWEQPTAQRQERNANNALTSGTYSTWPATKTKTYEASSTHYTRSNSQQTGNVFGALAEDASEIVSGGMSKTVLIALSAVVGVMALGYVVIGVVYLVSRRRARKAEKANRWYVRPEMAGRSLVPTVEEKYDTPAH